jgi:hypothetical protein
MSERETVVELPFAADCCPCVEKLRTVLPLTVGIRDGAAQLVCAADDGQDPNAVQLHGSGTLDTRVPHSAGRWGAPQRD